MARNRDRIKISAEDKQKAVNKIRLLYLGNLWLYNWYVGLVREERRKRDLQWKLLLRQY